MNKVILLYGMPAAGKLTIAKMIANQPDHYLIDNHYVHDFVRPFIGSHEGAREYWDIAGNIFEGLIKAVALFYPKDKPVTYVFTQVIRDNENGPKEVERYTNFAKAINGQFIPIALTPNYETRKSRCVDEKRKQRKKIHTIEKMDRVIGEHSKLIEIENSLFLDTTNMSIEQTHDAVMEHIAKIIFNRNSKVGK